MINIILIPTSKRSINLMLFPAGDFHKDFVIQALPRAVIRTVAIPFK